MDNKNILINQNKSILDALFRLNEITKISRLILFVVNNDKQVIGSLTDGDIRRSLIEKQDLNLQLKHICNKNFVHMRETDSYINFQIFRDQDLKILPILNIDNSLSRIIDLNVITSHLPIECMIMAGGRGKRLSPLTDNIPKPMLKLGEKPIIEHNIDRLISFGIKKIYISLNYLGDQIESYFGDGKDKGIEIEYIREDKFMGTAGSLSLIKDIKSKHILLMNGDLFTNVDFEKMYSKLINQKADMVIASKDYKVDVPYAIFNSENSQISSFKEKPSYIYHSNSGIYIFDKKLINKIPKNSFYDITDLIQDILTDKKVIHDTIRGYWIDIGKPVDYERALEFCKHR